MKTTRLLAALASAFLAVPAAGAPAAPGAAAPRQVLPFIEDDYAKALAAAKGAKKPIVLEAWAPW